MSAFTLLPSNRADLLERLEPGAWMIACLCADWCDVCKQYRPAFDRLAAANPGVQFVWIDVEDEADVVGDLDVDNFPTLLIQRGDDVRFFGAVLPEIGITERLVSSYRNQDDDTTRTSDDPNRQRWQTTCNLRELLRNSL